jgi:NAD(P)-dependent dehydrogenase (short-subunit alcohol dehydrogenase family)
MHELKRLKDKVALITGAGSGIGRATAILFAEEGAKVVVVDVNEEGANETVRLIKANGGEAVAVKADVTKESDVERMVKISVEKYGKIDVLFNNAGVSLIGRLIDTTEKEWNRTIDINLKGIFLCSKHVVPQMMKQGGGSIINAGSEAGIIGHANYTVYCASKGGVIQLTRAMAVELAPYNIRVNCTCPGWILTPMAEWEFPKFFLGKSREEAIQLISKSVPLGRIGKPEDVARAVLFFASDESSYVTGAALRIDGGLTLGAAA